MPTTLPYTGAQTPTLSEAGSGPANLYAYALTTEDQHVLKATSVSDRDTKYANVAAGTLVSCAALGIVWQKVTSPPTAAEWRVLAEVGAPVTSGVISPATGFTVSSQWARRTNGRVDLYASFSYTATDAIVVSSTGNTTDTAVGTLQSGWQLASGISVCVANGMIPGRGDADVFINSAQNILMADVSPGGNLATGFTLWVAFSYPAA